MYNEIMVYFARHGETDANRQNLFNGETDLDLNRDGIEQAQKQAKELASIKFDEVFCSPKRRAVQTCEIIIGVNKFTIDNRITELNCGKYDGKKRNIVSKILFLDSLKKGKNGVEHIEAFVARNIDFCEEVLKPEKGKNLLIVSHHGNAAAFDFYFKGKPRGYNFTKRIVENGGILVFDL